MDRQCIWTGDTTTHGGVLLEGMSNFTYANKNRAVCVGHKFWCPQCFCWSVFVEGDPSFTIDGKARVLNGYKASCGALALHQLGIQDWSRDDSRGSAKNTVRDEYNEARSNQSKKGKYFHTFSIINNSREGLKYMVFSGDMALDIGTASAKGGYIPSTISKITTDNSCEIQLAVQAPRLKYK